MTPERVTRFYQLILWKDLCADILSYEWSSKYKRTLKRTHFSFLDQFSIWLDKSLGLEQFQSSVELNPGLRWF